MSRFIVLEGIDGSGKSSVIDKLKDTFENTYFTREPTDSEIGKLAKKGAKKKHSPYLDLFLYLADRVSHTEEIKEILSSDVNVICDRYWGSTSAYQGASEEITLEYSVKVQKPIVLKPDLTILLDIEPKTGIDRISQRNEKSKYERIRYLEKVRNNYFELAEKYGWTIIDAESELEKVTEEVITKIKEVM